MAKTFLWHSMPIGGKRHTFAATLSDDSVLRMSGCTCNPKEQFERKRGREIALGRLNKGKTIFIGAVKEDFRTTDFVQLAQSLT